MNRAITEPEQEAGYTKTDLTNCVLSAIRTIRDDPILAKIRDSRRRIEYLDDMMEPFADGCGVDKKEFKSYLAGIVGRFSNERVC